MPYIHQDSRIELKDYLEPLEMKVNDQGVSEGELNFLVTRLLLSWLATPSYKAYNAAIGVLECVKQELYRREIAGYEQDKRYENGDVYSGKYDR